MQGSQIFAGFRSLHATSEGREIAAPLLIGLAVFAACLFGIATRPAGLLAAMWPANALLLGLMVRLPRLASLPCWLAATVSYILADLVTGGALLQTILLTGGNLTSVFVGYVLLSRVSVEDKRLQRPVSVLKLAMLATIAAAACGCVGALFDPILFNGSWASGWALWFASELVNFIAILPLLLSLPEKRSVAWTGRELRRHLALPRVLPAAALLASCAASVAIGGPGAIAFPVPALLWCALAYSMPSTSVLTLLFCLWTMVAISQGVFALGADFNSRHALLSIRLGVTLIALAPLTLASAMAERNRLLAGLRHLAMHDELTGALSRRAFTEGCGALIDSRDGRYRPLALLALDLDHFKRINDAHGHAIGDNVLVLFADVIRQSLRETDLFGRTGGEEFAILLPRCDRTVAEAIAERIRTGFAAATTLAADGEAVGATVSIGVVCPASPPESLAALFCAGDRALYRAKAAGRNRIEFADAIG